MSNTLVLGFFASIALNIDDAFQYNPDKIVPRVNIINIGNVNILGSPKNNINPNVSAIMPCANVI
jgi:hypothetical protein